MADRSSATRPRSAVDKGTEHFLSSPSSTTATAPAPAPALSTPSGAAKLASPAAFQPSPSSRVTRSSTRKAADQAANQADQASPTPAAASAVAAAVLSQPSSVRTPAPSSARKKRKPQPQSSPGGPNTESPSSGHRSKRLRVTQEPPPPPLPAARPAQPAPVTAPRRRKGKATAAMSSPDAPAAPAGNAEGNENAQSTSSSRRSSRHKQNTQGGIGESAAPSSGSSRRARKSAMEAQAQNQDVVMTGTDEHEDKASVPPPPPPAPPAEEHPEHPEHPDDDSDDNDDDDEDRYDRDDDDDPFGGFGGPGGPLGLSHTLRALTGMITGMSAKLRDILTNLRNKEDPTLQLVALQELSEILLVSNEDNLNGHFHPDQFVKELVTLMQPHPITGEENPEIMLLACRCLANLMEALPASTANVVYGGAVPVLCQKLLEISFIDLAEQALSTLEKISVEYPSSIVREGGLTACLSYLEFFPTSTQRSAVTTAANCCRNIPEDSFPVIRDVMPILLNVLGSGDQRVVEQGSLCVTRIVESFKYHSQRLEELVSVDLLKAVLRLLLPGTTNLIGPHIHTQFLRVLAFTARASPRLSAELLKMNVVETLYQILTGVSPPSGTDDIASKLDSVLIMQALIHRPRDQIIETLNVVCELLPSLPRAADPAAGDFVEMSPSAESIAPASGPPRRRTSNEKRTEFLTDCKDVVRRFALILFPTLTDAFSSTVNLTVRQKVLTAQLKMLYNLDENILMEALKPVPYASFLASILSQKDDLTLVMLALQATELLMSRLDSVYRYQLYREGVISEIAKLSEDEPAPVAPPATRPAQPETEMDTDVSAQHALAGSKDTEDELHEDEPEDGDDDGEDDDEDDGESQHLSDVGEEEADEGEGADEGDEVDEDDEGDDDGHDNELEIEHHHDDMSPSPVSSEGSTMSIDGPPRPVVSFRSRIAAVAKRFLEVHETERESKSMKTKALEILTNLASLAADIKGFYLRRATTYETTHTGIELFAKLASYFDSDVLESVTSAELLQSGIVGVLEEIFSNPDEELAIAAQAAFLQVFMGYNVKSKPKTATAESPATPLSVMIHKLQDLLSRSEHFEVLTVHHGSVDGNRSSAASMLAKQIRLKLVASDDSNIPEAYRNVMVSIHAIGTFKSLDDYLRPRISLSERPRQAARRDALSRTLAAIAGSGHPLSAAAARLAAARPAAAHSTPPPPPYHAAPPQAASSSRSSRKSKSKSDPSQNVPATPDPSSSRDKAVLRRSSRNHPASEPAPPKPPLDDEDDLEDALECADEKQLSDDEEMGEGSALSMVEDLDDGMDEEPSPDPSAVNLEVAEGGKITARKEDGTRVATPSQARSGSLPSRASALTAALQGTPTPPTATSRALSYAQAIQAVPQDWHIEFSVDGKPIPNDMTIYRAVHGYITKDVDTSSRNSIWTAVHPIQFRRKPGPPPTETTAFAPSFDSSLETEEGGTPSSLAKNPVTASILRLLRKLHDLNANIDDVLVENKEVVKVNVEPLSQFVNTKLTAKLNRQLEEPLIVASNCLPSWSEDLARLYPFLFPFETRHLFLQSTSFGYARSMSRWQNAQSQEETRRSQRDERPFLGRLQRQKVRISRSKILEAAVKVMELYGASQSMLEVEYFEEVGTGLGPTLEFYSTVSKEFSKKKLKLWRDNDPGADDEFVSGPAGLFPRPISDQFASSEEGEKILQLFKMLGKFVARAMLDSRIIDINFNPIFFRIGDESTAVRPSLGAIKSVDPMIAQSLMMIKRFAMAKRQIDEDPNRDAAQKVAEIQALVVDNTRIEDLYLDFTLPGYPEIELIPNGGQTRLTIDNVDLYLEKVIDMTLGSGVRRQVDAFRAGFSQVFPYSALSAFTPDELCNLFGRVDEDWSIETLLDSIKADHGFNMDSKSVRNLLRTMSELTPTERREFLQFTTGSPKLPIGGFKKLTPMFTVVCKPSEAPYTSDDYLPSVMTCVNYLKLPDYTDHETLKRRLFMAFKEGQGAFHLS